MDWRTGELEDGVRVAENCAMSWTGQSKAKSRLERLGSRS